MKYFLVAGEASGDLHGGNLIKALREADPSAQFAFLGGDCMASTAGVPPVVHFKQMAFMGFVAVVRNLNKISSNEHAARKAILTFRPDKIILIDYPGFNLRLARWAKENFPSAETLYYISPKLWAWKSYRIRAVRRYVDRMFTIFPFETEWYARRGYQVNYVGNPTVDSVASFRASLHIDDTPAAAGIEQPLPRAGHRPVVALLPGSRMQEITRCLPRMAALAPLFPDCRFVVAAAPAIDRNVYNRLVGDRVEVVSHSTYQLLSTATAAVVNSGTATLETALLGVPQLVVYNVIGGVAARALKKMFIKTKHVSLVNIIAGHEVVTELIADRFTVKNMQRELRKILTDDAFLQEIRKNYSKIADELGGPGTAQRCAKLILS